MFKLTANPCQTKAIRIAAKLAGVELTIEAPSCKGECGSCGPCVTLEHAGNEIVGAPIVVRYIARVRPEAALFGQGLKEEMNVEKFIGIAIKACGIQQSILPVLTDEKMGKFFNRNALLAQKAMLMKMLTKVNEILISSTFLVGHRVTIADVLLTCALSPAMAMLLGPKQREALPNLVRWFMTVRHNAAVKEVLGEIELCVTPLPDHPPKKAKAKKEPKKKEAQAPKKAKAKKEAKPKRPVFAFAMYDWKKEYANEFDTWKEYFWPKWETEAKPQFSMYSCVLENPESVAACKADWKAANLVSMWVQRLTANKINKNGFGNVVVTKVDGEDFHRVVGVMMLPGTELPEDLVECPGSSSYVWKRIDDVEGHVDFINKVWDWDEENDIILDGQNFGKACDGATLH
eukprot:gnl/Dysnectes_brevis/596_a658_6839.p1 GENE.gnl/Dysnectes_brevis/596_a658_6839~~gnl/Dysnectes_brevis/596_a658_6839.p1  ORF type:complete len:403 (+),score=187.52 gnl/Dysnectes_brevis/596_a658_6839:43-1251(+)